MSAITQQKFCVPQGFCGCVQRRGEDTQTKQPAESTQRTKAVAVRKQTQRNLGGVYASIEFPKRTLSRLTPQPRGKEQWAPFYAAFPATWESAAQWRILYFQRNLLEYVCVIMIII
jgi:hypothetical protein